jgi:hypothetical protein
MWTDPLPPVLAKAVWEGDVDLLNDLAPCRCCCHEHTLESCEARLWGGCRGQYTMTRAEALSWARHYELFHGMSEEQFFCY